MTKLNSFENGSKILCTIQQQNESFEHVKNATQEYSDVLKLP